MATVDFSQKYMAILSTHPPWTESQYVGWAGA